ncbi:hypothetical protein [Burkholderia sp. Ac-20365]|uniref:Mom family adenine methylcarbamoylation protein n=1 Tax=Burkholderia sp. Ac-20365 TaxID=2703897 RepID=UPI00197BDE41|nr:hypothetical protein [Burkholderia sp. Ac-20365]MBN3760886.1 hypothetical protein [Burkholderia sp. Ac-20365]
MNPSFLTTAACPSQRWKMGKAFWRLDRDEGFRGRDYSVDMVADGVARRFVVENHYSHSYPAAVERMGLFRGKDLVGVCIFSVGMNNAAVPKYLGLPASDGIDLGRLIIDESVPYCGESWFVSRCFKLLHEARPNLRGVIAYADPVPRQADTGELIMPGHLGTIYKALSSTYLGRSTARTHHINGSGIVVSPRAISKIRLGENGAQGAERSLVRLGAPARRFGQDPAEWLSDVLSGDTFRKVRHPGNHVYAFALGRPHEKRRLQKAFAPAKPYPKKLDPIQQGFDLFAAA